MKNKIHMDPLEILPPELWEAIFDRVKDPSDWLNFYRVSPSFEGPVGGKKAAILLPQILPFVLPHLDEERANGMLSHRLVCKDFKKAVDNRVESDGNLRRHCKTKYKLDDLTQISSFVQRFESHTEIPMISRSIGIDYASPREDARWNQQDGQDQEQVVENEIMQSRLLMTRFLGKFGNHLRQLRIDDHCMGRNSFDYFLNLVESFVRLAPNLEKLSVGYHNTFWPTDNNIVVPFVEENDRHPVPILSNLKSISFQSEGDLVEHVQELQNGIIRMCCNASSLRSAIVQGVPSELTNNFPQLESVKIFGIYNEQDRSNLADADWPLLTELGIYAPSCSFREIFGYAEKFKKTLTSLLINNVPGVGEDFKFGIDLPQLRFLRIRRKVPFHILGNLVSLEELWLYSLAVFQNEERLKGYLDTVGREGARTRLWTLLPKLKRIVVGGTSQQTAFRRVLLRSACERFERKVTTPSMVLFLSLLIIILALFWDYLREQRIRI